MHDQENRLLEDIILFIESEADVYGPIVHTNPASVSSMNQETLSKISHSGEEIGPAPGVHPVDIPVSNAARENQPDTIPSPGSPINIPAPVNRQHSLEDQLMSCSGLDELLELCNSADELKTDLENTRLVFGTGNPNADLMLIGEAPGEQEDLREEPFVGAAGQLLNKILEAIQFKREDVYIANILKHRPPGNRNPEPEERTRSLPYLIRQIELIQPKLILCLGKVSGNTLLNHEEPLKSMRGRFYPFKGAELTVTYHPAALLRNPHWKRPVWEDVQKLRKRYDELGCKP